ncbi:MAG: pyridoxamine kinase [Clostridia bacterium]|nr:pyridoxamine kinase [Clostridia bacterium]
MQKRVAAIHDISCFGKCSITVALPLISAAGIETAVIPTAVLSTHTAGFKDYTFRDLTEDIIPVAKHWKSEGITVDAVYSGYLGSKEQIDLVGEAVDYMKNDDTIFVVDPVMADHGVLYGGFAPDFPLEMKRLCAKADVITPNITEACFMTGTEYKSAPYEKEYIENLVMALSKITNGKIVLTGVAFNEQEMGAACYENGKIEYIFSKKVDAMYHGTGDIFTSVLTAAILRGKTLSSSAQLASDFTADCIKLTKESYPEMTYGVNFEAKIPDLLKMLGIC